MDTSKIIKLIVSIVFCQLAGAIGSIFTTPSIPTWYAGLKKPFFNPPNWLFGPVWVTLFLLMGISFYIIWENKRNKNSKRALNIFATQLMLNILWSILFFELKNPLYAFIEIIVLWIMILVTIKEFYKISKKAACLLIPYILWVSFAALLNFSIFIINP